MEELDDTLSEGEIEQLRAYFRVFAAAENPEVIPREDLLFIFRSIRAPLEQSDVFLVGSSDEKNTQPLEQSDVFLVGSSDEKNTLPLEQSDVFLVGSSDKKNTLPLEQSDVFLVGSSDEKNTLPLERQTFYSFQDVLTLRRRQISGRTRGEKVRYVLETFSRDGKTIEREKLRKLFLAKVGQKSFPFRSEEEMEKIILHAASLGGGAESPSISIDSVVRCFFAPV